MATTEIVVGAPAWDRAWCLDLWFESVRANVDPTTTGLCFVVPPTDTATRDAISRLSEGFLWVEVLRDRGRPVGREDRPGSAHANLAVARNQILQVVERVSPAHYLSWDTDLLVPPESVDRLRYENQPLMTVWTWLNRQRPKQLHWMRDGYPELVYWQEPVRATAMGWDERRPGRARHYPGSEYVMRSNAVWQAGVALAFQLMDARAYRVAHYAPHHDGEDVPFNWTLRQRGVPVFCCGDIQGLHLYDRAATYERELGWPRVLTLAKQTPLAAGWDEPRPVEYEALGFFPGGRDG